MVICTWHLHTILQGYIIQTHNGSYISVRHSSTDALATVTFCSITEVFKLIKKTNEQKQKIVKWNSIWGISPHKADSSNLYFFFSAVCLMLHWSSIGHVCQKNECSARRVQTHAHNHMRVSEFKAPLRHFCSKSLHVCTWSQHTTDVCCPESARKDNHLFIAF